MGKINWGTTAEVLGGVGTQVMSKLKDKKQANKQKTDYGSGPDSSLTSGSADPPSYKRGGKVRKTGIAKVHKGERVLTKSQQKKYCGRK